MFDNLFSTKMSANKKAIQGRFRKIRQRDGRKSKWLALVISLSLLVTAVFATVVIANVESDGQGSEITFTANGKELHFSNQPFIAYNTVYLPLRELLTKLDVLEQEKAVLGWDNGNVFMTIPNLDGGVVHYGVVINDARLGISQSAPLNTENILKMALGMDAPPLLIGSSTYLPYEYFDYMLDRGTERVGRYQLTCTVNGEMSDFDLFGEIRSGIAPDEWGLTMAAKDVTPRGATLVFRQNGDKPEGKLQFGQAYGLEQYKDGEWVSFPLLPGREDVAFYQVAYMLDENARGIETGVNWYPLYGELSPGIYRIAKDVMLFRGTGDYDTKTYYAEFVVTDSLVYHTPDFVWPTNSDTISRAFGTETNPLGKEIQHNGIDLVAPVGTMVLSATDGEVTEAAFDAEKGNYVVVENINGIKTTYAHLDEVLVTQGAQIMRGADIGTVGNTGMSTGPHLHFEISINGRYYNPELVY